jgi:hypothetical protein
VWESLAGVVPVSVSVCLPSSQNQRENPRSKILAKGMPGLALQFFRVRARVHTNTNDPIAGCRALMPINGGDGKRRKLCRATPPGVHGETMRLVGASGCTAASSSSDITTPGGGGGGGLIPVAFRPAPIPPLFPPVLLVLSRSPAVPSGPRGVSVALCPPVLLVPLLVPPRVLRCP